MSSGVTELTQVWSLTGSLLLDIYNPVLMKIVSQVVLRDDPDYWA